MEVHVRSKALIRSIGNIVPIQNEKYSVKFNYLCTMGDIQDQENQYQIDA